MKIIDLCKKYRPIKTAYRAYRMFEGLADVCYISEGTPNRRFEPLSETGWELVEGSGDAQFTNAKEMLSKGWLWTAIFIKTSSVAGQRKVYVAGQKRRDYNGEPIVINPRRAS